MGKATASASEPCGACAATTPTVAANSASAHGPTGWSDAKRTAMTAAMSMLRQHELFTREIENLSNGVRSVTRTNNAAALALLKSHPRQMESLYKSGDRVRNWDPVFRELANRHKAVTMAIRDLEDGIEVTATSEDPYVAKLLQTHAAKVNEFVARGHAAFRETSTLPERD